MLCLDKKGFALAEVLITLVIIGVIAVLTIPNLVVKYQKHILETQLKKVFSVVSEGVSSAIVKSGAVSDWPWDDVDALEKEVLSSNFKYEKVYKFRQPVTESKYFCDAKYNYQWINGSGITSPLPGGAQSPVGIEFEDGTCVVMDKRGYVFFDINGSKVLPNQLARDLFFLKIDEKKGVLTSMSTGESMCPDVISSYPVSDPHLGTSCIWRIIRDGWKITYDYENIKRKK